WADTRKSDVATPSKSAHETTLAMTVLVCSEFGDDLAYSVLGLNLFSAQGYLWNQFQKVPFCPISASGAYFKPRKTERMPAVKIGTIFDLGPTETF
ncbi:MAG: hypothetical protein V2I56_26010, partial [Desulfobacteraceae bacterium]|nr:hypothetical protein [Desulfobacteraceae bacterium]